jgi:hypothetical protein
MSKLNDKEFVATICQQLDRSVENLPGSVLERLDTARNGAFKLAHQSIPDDDAALATVARHSLEDYEPLPKEIETRLDQIRQQAIARLDSHSKQPNGYLKPWRERLQALFGFDFSAAAGFVATACVMVTVVSLFYVSRPTGVLTTEEEMMLVASAEDIELYENLDFYLWLAESGIPN